MAATITGSIKVNIVNATDPSFVGVYTGDFSYDDTHLTKAGEEYMTINGDGNLIHRGCYLGTLDFWTLRQSQLLSPICSMMFSDSQIIHFCILRTEFPLNLVCLLILAIMAEFWGEITD